MSITNATNPPISYKIDSGTLTQADWDFLFQIFAEEDIAVILDGVLQTLNSDYTVAINGEAGGTVTFDAAVVDTFTVGKIITLFRNLAAVRQTSYTSTQRFDPNDVDNDMDYLTSLSGQVNGNFNQLAARFPTNYPFINIPGYNLLPVNWPNGYALVNQNGTLTTAPIQSNPGDPSLRGELATQVAPNEGTRLVGHTGETLYNYIEGRPKIAASAQTLDGAGNFTPSRSFNVASIMKVALGKYQINFTNNLAHIEYQVACCAITTAFSWHITALATSEVIMQFFNSAGAAADSRFSIFISIIGT